MEVKTCRKCGALFNYISGPPLCPRCRDALEQKFQEVRDYIRENKTATMQQISKDMDVSQNQIRQWVREERLEFTDDSPVQMECEVCGARIKTGRMCEACKQKLATNLGNVYKKPAAQKAPEKKFGKKENDQMRFLQS